MTQAEADEIAQARSPGELRKYGLNRASYAAMVLATGPNCPLCAKAFTRDRRRPRTIDHNHLSGLFRGIICRQCNDKIGYLHENSEWMHRTASYLDYPPSLHEGIAVYHKDVEGK